MSFSLYKGKNPFSLKRQKGFKVGPMESRNRNREGKRVYYLMGFTDCDERYAINRISGQEEAGFKCWGK